MSNTNRLPRNGYRIDSPFRAGVSFGDPLASPPRNGYRIDSPFRAVSSFQPFRRSTSPQRLSDRFTIPGRVSVAHPVAQISPQRLSDRFTIPGAGCATAAIPGTYAAFGERCHALGIWPSLARGLSVATVDATAIQHWSCFRHLPCERSPWFWAHWTARI